MDGKLRYRPKIFMKSPRFKTVFSSSNCNNKREVGICPAAQILFSVQPISRVIDVQMSSFLFCWKYETNAQNFHERLHVQIMMLAMMFGSDKKIIVVTKSRGGHPLNN
jgi:hypothetical protein